MACCGYNDKKSRLLSIMIAFVVSFWAGIFTIILSPFVFLRPIRTGQEFARSLFSSFYSGFKEELKKPILGDRIRCLISGRLLHRAPWLSRAVYHHHNILLLAPLAIIIIIASILSIL